MTEGFEVKISAETEKAVTELANNAVALAELFAKEKWSYLGEFEAAKALLDQMAQSLPEGMYQASIQSDEIGAQFLFGQVGPNTVTAIGIANGDLLIGVGRNEKPLETFTVRLSSSLHTPERGVQLGRILVGCLMVSA